LPARFTQALRRNLRCFSYAKNYSDKGQGGGYKTEYFTFLVVVYPNGKSATFFIFKTYKPQNRKNEVSE
jgi:hypothetical protein